MNDIRIVSVTSGNVDQETLFCIKNIKKPGYEQKKQWFEKRYEEGLRMMILKDGVGRMIAFIEYMPADKAWRPVDAPGYMFIHCMMVYGKNEKGKGYGSILIEDCENRARSEGMQGVCTMTSKGAWIYDKSIFEKNGYKEYGKRGRFELMAKKFDEKAADPKLINWEARQKEYSGWHLIYADQCPWHEKSVNDISKVARENEIVMNVHKLESSEEAKNAPSGFGVFSLLHDGKLLEDHYISATRFKNILKKELKNK